MAGEVHKRAAGVPGIDRGACLDDRGKGHIATGKVLFWNLSTGDQATTPVIVSSEPVTSIAFDSTGQRFATTAAGDGMVKLWSTSTLQQEGTALNTDPAATSMIAFEPGGRRLLVIDDRGNGFTWPMSLTAWEQHACAVAARNLTPQEWARFVNGHNYARVCPRANAQRTPCAQCSAAERESLLIARGEHAPSAV
ncbi:MAG: WD40 repeat domain-containing protein, partial [Solirubrobacterales bacterium]